MTKHPAKFSGPLLDHLARYVDGTPFCDLAILDPFAGTGRVGQLHKWLTRWDESRGVYRGPSIAANEIEPEWAKQCRANGCNHVSVGDARSLPWGPGAFDAVVTSPTYGNRMADSCEWAEGRKHSTYHSALGRKPSSGSSAVLQWGDAYRRLHREVWAECWRVLVPGGRLVLNIADHYRDGQLQGVPEWHVSALLALGFVLLDYLDVDTQRYGFGANAEKRSPELVIVMAKPGTGPRWAWDPETVTLRNPSGRLWDVRPEPQQLSLI